MSFRDLIQKKLRAWACDLFGAETASTKRTRLLRFFEEAAELVQAGDLSKEDAQLVLDTVYSRPKGEFGQEIGGVMVTLYLAAELHDYSVEQEEAREIERIHTPEVMEKCRRRQAEKKALGL
jgi:NTP pyrophosphatase (non-canonical NTP hydrolase)